MYSNHVPFLSSSPPSPSITISPCPPLPLLLFAEYETKMLKFKSLNIQIYDLMLSKDIKRDESLENIF